MRPPDIWADNLNILQNYFPDIHREFSVNSRHYESSIRFESVPGRSRHVLIRRGKDQWAALHSRVDPFKEAKRFADGLKLSRNQNLVIFGLGLGYHVRDILGRRDRPGWITVIEGDLLSFWAFCHLDNIEFLFNTGGLFTLIKTDSAGLFNFFAPHSMTIMANGVKIVRHEPSCRFNLKYYEEADKKIVDFCGWANANMMTQIKAANTFSKNIFCNLRTMIRSIPFSNYNNRFKNIPCIIISAGPSLGKNGHLLKKAKGRAVLVAVDSSIGFLRENGVEPDFIISMDFTRNAADYFSKDMASKKTVLIADPEVYPDIPSGYPGPVSFFDIENKAVCEWLRPVLGNFGVIAKGMSVSHTAFLVSAYMGCEPLIFAGQDLSFHGGSSHVKGSAHGVPVSDAGCSVRVEGLFGQVMTSSNLKLFRDHFEEMIAGFSGRVINATEGGALIRGAGNMTLREVILNVLPSDAETEGIPASTADSVKGEKLLPCLREHLDSGISHLRSLENLCRMITGLMKDLIGCVEAPDVPRQAAERVLKKYISASGSLAEFKDMLELVRDNMLDAFMQKARKYPREFEELDIFSGNSDDKSLAAEILTTNLLYYEKTEKASAVMREQMSSAIKNLK